MRSFLVVAMGIVTGCGDAGDGAALPEASRGDATPWSEAGTVEDGGARVTNDAAVGSDAAADASSDGAACIACDDFEHYAVGQTPSGLWTIATPSCSGTGAIAIDDGQAHSGTRSVMVTGAGGYCNHVFFATPIAAALPITWARFYVRFDALLGNGHTTFLAMRDAEDGKDLRMGGQNGVLMFNRESDDATLPAMSPTGTASSLAPRTATWTCIEVAIDTSAKTIRTWVDGAAVTGLVEDGIPTPDVDDAWLRNTAWSPSLVDVRFGWESYGDQAETLWFDDVAIGASRFGCQSP